jgi:hypothetical protein
MIMKHIFSNSQSARALWRRSRRAAAIVTAGLVMAGCSSKDLLDVQLDAITPQQAQSAAGALAQRAAAIRDFALYFGYNISAWTIDGLISDQLINARGGLESLDYRTLNEAVGLNPWSSFSATHYSTLTAIRNMRKYLPDDATRANYIGHLQSLFGFSLIITAELYCNGLPLSEIKEDGTFYNDPHMYSNAELYNMAITYFDSALTALPANDGLRNMARIGKARALLDLAKYAEAAAVVSSAPAVPTSYVYNVEYSATVGSLTNGIFDWMPNSGNFGTPKTPKGINGLNWDADPRIGVSATPLRTGQDGTTPVYMPTAVVWARTSTSTPIPLATGQEARMIEAEADLKAGGTNWLVLLNALRSGQTTFNLPPLTDPGNADGRIKLIMKERAMWMYLTVHRVGDLRRLVRQYGYTQDQVFPTGAYFKGGTYGTDVNSPVPQREQNNPNYTPGSCKQNQA